MQFQSNDSSEAGDLYSTKRFDILHYFSLISEQQRKILILEVT